MLLHFTMKKSWLPLVTVVSICCIALVTANDDYYYVTSNGTDCPPSENSTCEVLSFYTNNSDYYFHNNAVFVFLEGIHNLEHSVVVSGVSNLSFIGTEQTVQGIHETVTLPLSVIMCFNDTNNIIFNNHSANISFTYITIRNCSGNTTFRNPFFPGVPPVALFFHESFDIKLNHLTILDCHGYGLVVWNGYGVQIQSSTFTNNWANAYVLYTSPDTCFNSSESYEFNVVSTNFTFSQSNPLTSGYGLIFTLNNLLTYEVNIKLDNVVTYYNTFNIYIQTPDGYPRSLTITDIITSNGNFGIAITSLTGSVVNMGEVTTNCEATIPSSSVKNSNITIYNSYFADNTYTGIFMLIDPFSVDLDMLSLHVLIYNCTVTTNGLSGIYLDRTLNERSLMTIKIQESTIQYNSYSNSEAAIFIYRTLTYIDNVVISDNSNTGLLLLDAEVFISGSRNAFVNNSGFNGGAIGLYHSDMSIVKNTNISFASNNARNKGGALYIERVCGVQISDNQHNNTLNNITLTFINNTALIGNDVYGLSSPSHCTVNLGNLGNSIYLNTAPGKSLGSATNSVGVCRCDPDDLLYSLSVCYKLTYNNRKVVTLDVSLYPGDYIEIPIVVVGYGGKGHGGNDSYSLTDGVIDYLVDYETYDSYPYNGTYCYNFKHIVNQPSQDINSTDIYIGSQPNYLNFLSSRTNPALFLHVSLLQCPMGFKLANGICQCIDVLENVSAQIDCNIDKEEIMVTREGHVWYGTINLYDEICYITDTTCGYNYCYDGKVTFDLRNGTDQQCSFDRSGLLCSKCAEGHSLKLGSNECDDCSNASISLVILFILAGIALIVLILALNLTVAVGTINGLIFYANVVKMYEHIFFPNKSMPVISQFISWINLDFGIPLCFYDGMDTYAKSWLQFVFPFYIWLLILIIIGLCQLSARLSQLFGSRVVSALSTLFLLSYIKLLRSIIFVLSPHKITITCNGDKIEQNRWLGDPTMHYFDQKHSVLFVFAVVLLLVFVIPYTLGLLFSPILQGYLSQYKMCSFWYKLKPVFDAYNAPYKDKLRFWTGFLLLLRLPILAAASVTNSFETDKNAFLSIALICIVIAITTSSIVGGVYRVWYLNLLETCFFINIAVLLIAATNNINSISYKVVLILSITLSMIGFIGIIIFHVYLKFSKGGLENTESKMQSLAEKFTMPPTNMEDKSTRGRKRSSVFITSAAAVNNEWYTNSTSNEEHATNESSKYRSSSLQIRRRETLLLDDDSINYVLLPDTN